MKSTILAMVISVSLFCGCKRHSQGEVDKKTFLFERNDFKETKELLSYEKIEIEDALHPYRIYLVKDSLLLIDTKSSSQEYKVGLYSLTSGKLHREMAHKGNGPEEFIDCTLDVRNSCSDIFYMEDAVQNKYWICSVDSVLSGKNYLLRSFTYSRDVIRLCPFDNEYVGYNFWYLNNDEYDNQVRLLDRYAMTNAPKGRLGTGHPYFVANVTGGYVFTNNKQRICVSHFYDDCIDFYDDSLHLVKRLKGPDMFRPEYKKIKENNYQYVVFEKDTYYKAYLAYTLTPDCIYVAYEGTNGTPHTTNNLKSVEIFKLDWDGNLLCNYKLNKHAISISVDSEEKYLYAACSDAYDGEVELLRYELK